ETEVEKKIEVYADPLFGKVFYNFIDNSIRHGSEKISSIRLSTINSGESLKIIYEDDGTGIPFENKDKIFLKGFGSNTGYGLFLIKYVLSMTGMNICESGVPGEGVRFEINVPNGRFRYI
ncbi:MAG: HAMP domain-containing sensor histidine kinase, partial [Methanomicrobium sp.]|nr:HAMP domain-containing sensor histidine kinase [Methanomicrobium sp.]